MIIKLMRRLYVPAVTGLRPKWVEAQPTGLWQIVLEGDNCLLFIQVKNYSSIEWVNEHLLRIDIVHPEQGCTRS